GKDCLFVQERLHASVRERQLVCPGKVVGPHKQSRIIDHFWDLQVKRQNISVEIKLLEEKSKLLEKQQNELENEIDLEQRNPKSGGGLLQKEVTKKIENRVTGHKRAREEKPSNPPKKIKSSGKKGDTLPDGTKIEKPTPMNLVPSDDDSFFQDDLPPEESLEFILKNQRSWILPSRQNVYNIITENISANVMAVKKKKRLSAVEKA
ncbi:407_t:CDS:2, partial [Acaulospora colombiana]